MKRILLLSSIFLSAILLSSKTMAQQALPYSQDFEGSTFLPTGWQRFGSNVASDWSLNTTVGGFGQSNQCASFDNFSVNLTGNYYGMRAMALDLSDAVQPVMRFDVAYARRNATNSDVLGIWYSYNGSTGWVNLMNYQDATLTTAPDQATEFIPTASQWDSIVIDLSAFAGKPFIRFAFENNCRNGNVMYIDNVKFYDVAFLGVNEKTRRENALKVFPNPCSSQILTVRSEGFEFGSIRINDIHGRTIWQQETNQLMSQEVHISTVGLSTGIYSLQTTDSDGFVLNKKLMIQ